MIEEKKKQWIIERTKKNPTLTFCEIIGKLETIILTSVRAQRERERAESLYAYKIYGINLLSLLCIC